MIKRYDLQSEVEYIALGHDGKILKDPATGKGVVRMSDSTYSNMEAESKKEAILKYEAMVKKNYGSRFVSIKTKVTAVRD